MVNAVRTCSNAHLLNHATPGIVKMWTTVLTTVGVPRQRERKEMFLLSFGRRPGGGFLTADNSHWRSYTSIRSKSNTMGLAGEFQRPSLFVSRYRNKRRAV